MTEQEQPDFIRHLLEQMKTTERHEDVTIGQLLEEDGHVHIFGNVMHAQIKARGHIIIGGEVDGSIIESQYGSIFLLYGSMNSSILRAGQNVYMKHSSNSSAEAGHDIIIEQSILASHLRAKRTIISEVEDGRLVGGTACAGEGIVVSAIGNDRKTETVVRVESKTGRIVSQKIYAGVHLHLGFVTRFFDSTKEYKGMYLTLSRGTLNTEPIKMDKDGTTLIYS